MKKFFENNGLIVIISTLLLAVFVIGQVFSAHVISEREKELVIDEERYYGLVDLVSLEYNFDLETLGEKTYIAEFTYKDVSYEVYLNNKFSYVETISGLDLDRMVYSAVKHHAEKEAILQNTAYIVSYDSESKTLLMSAKGYAGSGSIVVEFILNSTLDGISSYTVTSTESYTNEYNDSYTGGEVPFVENTLIESYIANEALAADAVAGATDGTGSAMIELLALLDLFLDSMEGGN